MVCTQLFNHPLHGLFGNAALFQNGFCLHFGQPVKVFFTWSYQQSRHIQGAGTHQQLLFALGIVAIGTMLFTWDNHGDIIRIFPPAHNVHHWFSFSVALRQGLVNKIKERPVGRLVLTSNDKSRHYEAMKHADIVIAV